MYKRQDDDVPLQSIARLLRSLHILVAVSYTHLVAIGLHLEPALERLSNVQTIKNPLKDEIIRRHQEEFNYS